MKNATFIVPGAIVAAVAALSFTPTSKLSLDGAWSVVQVQTVKPDGSTTTVFPRESEAIFSHGHYSFCWTSHRSASPTWQMADSTKLRRFNQSIVNTGTYELTGSILTTKARFALNPMFVNGLAKFTCSQQGDTLVLKGLSVASATNVLHPAYAGGSHIVSKLVRAGTR